jgi:hypothetical protein
MDEEQQPLPSDEEPSPFRAMFELAKLTIPPVKWASVLWDYAQRALPDPYRRAQVASVLRSLGRSLTYEDDDILDPQTIEFLKNSPQGTWPQDMRRGEEDLPMDAEEREQLLLSIPEDWRPRFTSFDRRWQFRSMLQSLQDEEQWQRKVQAAPLSERVVGSLWQGYLQLTGLNKIAGGASLVKNLRPIGWLGRAAKTTASGAEIGAKLAAWESLLRPSAYPTEQLLSRALELAEKFGTFHLAAFLIAPITRPFIHAAKRSRLFNLWQWEQGKPAGFRYNSEPKEFSELRAAGKVREVIPLSEDMRVEITPEEYEARSVAPPGKYRYVQKFRGKGQEELPPQAPENPLEIWESFDRRAQEVIARDTDHADRLSKLLDLWDEAQLVPEKFLGEFLNPAEASPALACAVLAEDYASDLQSDFPPYRFEFRREPEPYESEPEIRGGTREPSEAEPKTGGEEPETAPEQKEAPVPSKSEPEPEEEAPETRGVLVEEYHVMSGREIGRSVPKNRFFKGLVDNTVFKKALGSPQSILEQARSRLANKVGFRLFDNNNQNVKERAISQVPTLESIKDEALRKADVFARFCKKQLKASGLTIDEFKHHLYFTQTHFDKAPEELPPEATAAIECVAKRLREIMNEQLSNAQKVGRIGFVLQPEGFSYRSQVYVRANVNKHLTEFSNKLRNYFLNQDIPPEVVADIVSSINLRLSGVESEAQASTEPYVQFNIDSYVERLAPNMRRRVIHIDPMELEDYVETDPVRFAHAIILRGDILCGLAKMDNDLLREHLIDSWKDKYASLKNRAWFKPLRKITKKSVELYFKKAIEELEKCDIGEILSEYLARNSIHRWMLEPVYNLRDRLRPEDIARLEQLLERSRKNDFPYEIRLKSPRSQKKTDEEILSAADRFLSSLADKEPPPEQLEFSLGRRKGIKKPESKKPEVKVLKREEFQAMDQAIEDRWRVESEQLPLEGIGSLEKNMVQEKGFSVVSPPPKHLSADELDSQYPIRGNKVEGFLYPRGLQELSDSLQKEIGVKLANLIGFPRYKTLSEIISMEYSAKNDKLLRWGERELKRIKQTKKGKAKEEARKKMLKKIDSLAKALQSDHKSTLLVINNRDDILLGSWGAPTSDASRFLDNIINGLRRFTMMTKLGHASLSVGIETHNTTARYGLVPFGASAMERTLEIFPFTESDKKDENAFLAAPEGMGLAVESAALELERGIGNLAYYLSSGEYGKALSHGSSYVYQSTGLPDLSDFERRVAWELIIKELDRALRENDTKWLRRNGIDPHSEKIIRPQFDKYATQGRLNFRHWEDAEAVRICRDVLRTIQNTLVMMPSAGSIPLILKGPIGKLFMQFKRIMLSGHRMILMPKLAEGDYSGLIRLVLHGALIGTFMYFLKWLATGAYKREKFFSYRTCKNIASKIDSFSFLVEGFEAAEALSGLGDFRDIVSIPAAGAIRDAQSAGKMFFSNPKEIFSPKGMRKIKKLIPVANNILLEPLWVGLGAYSDLEEKYERAKQKEAIARDYDARVKMLQRHISRPIPLYHEVEEQKKKQRLEKKAQREKLRREQELLKKRLHRR